MLTLNRSFDVSRIEIVSDTFLVCRYRVELDSRSMPNKSDNNHGFKVYELIGWNGMGTRRGNRHVLPETLDKFQGGAR